jgi:hypothetical protein
LNPILGQKKNNARVIFKQILIEIIPMIMH